jgi:hypothetical protein
MTKDAQVNISLNQEQKDRWDEYKEDEARTTLKTRSGEGRTI